MQSHAGKSVSAAEHILRRYSEVSLLYHQRPDQLASAGWGEGLQVSHAQSRMARPHLHQAVLQQLSTTALLGPALQHAPLGWRPRQPLIWHAQCGGNLAWRRQKEPLPRHAPTAPAGPRSSVQSAQNVGVPRVQTGAGTTHTSATSATEPALATTAHTPRGPALREAHATTQYEL